MRLFLPALFAATAAFSPQELPAQEPRASTGIVLLLRDPSGQPVEGAQGLLLLDPARQLPALAGIAPDALQDPSSAAEPPAAAVPPTARSDARGVLRLSAEGRVRAGAVLITTAAGLGAIVPRALPGDAQRVTLTPLGEVATATGSEQFELHTALTDLDGHRIVLPTQTGTAVRLPAGSYEAWARSDDGWTWQRLEIASGQRTTLQFAAPAQVLTRAPRTRVRPAGWPTIELLGEGNERCVLLGAALAAPLLGERHGDGGVVIGQVPGPPRRQPIVWPPTDAAPAHATVRLAEPTADARLFLLRRRDVGDWLPLAAAAADADGRFLLPAVSGGDDWLLAVAPGRAAFAMPWSGHNPPTTALALPRGLPLHVLCRTQTGELAVDVRLSFEPALGEVAATAARTDSRGRADFGLVAAPGRVLVSDARFANQQIDLRLVPQQGLHIELDAGAIVRGRALLDEQTAAAGALVTLRDPSGRLRPAQRAVLAAEDGTFAFAGLDETDRYVLFVTMLRDGRTWSARLADVATGGDGFELTLRDEDPRLTPDKDR